MELEKQMIVAAPLQKVWDLMLDPRVMAGCVPGTQSVEVISPTEYLAEIKVKISFIAARFKVRTRILEQRPPHYLRIEGTGEDASVASSMTQTSEIFLKDVGDGRTEIHIKAKADVLGRLGSFGLSVMKTKADRMWDEFGANFAAVAHNGAAPATTAPAAAGAAATDAVAAIAAAQGAISPLSAPQTAPQTTPHADPQQQPWWRRLVSQPAAAAGAVHAASMEPRQPGDICIELHRSTGIVRILWPASAAAEAAKWLHDLR